MTKKRMSITCSGIALIAIVGLIFISSSINCGSSSSTSNGRTVTTLKITNTGSTSLIIGFVSAAVGGACPSLSLLLTAEELFNQGWCTDFEAGVNGAGKCLVTIAAGSSVTVPNPDGKCMSGGFGAGGFASCETAEFPTGWTQGEFTLNPIASTQEAVDISAVNGVNYAVSILLGSNWFYGTNNFVTTVGPNTAINTNVGKPGVYPNGCTDCIELDGNPPCPGLAPDPPNCQASRICNVQRNNETGGTVEFQIGDLL